MKALVATRRTHGTREWDLWRSCIEGELVRPIEERCPEHTELWCSCEVAFIGLASGGLTTTAVVRELPALTLSEYTDAVGASLTPIERRFIFVDRYAEELVRVAESLRGDGPLERWDEWIGRRFDEDGVLSGDITSIANIDPRDLEDLA